jgi:hypothetical protein
MQKSRLIRSGWLAAAALILILTSGLGHAQRYLGSIQGEVTDATGAVVPNADVTAEETTTHFKTISKTNASGVYTFGSLNPGSYNVTTSSAGFRSETRLNVTLTAGNLAQVDFQLVPGTSTQTVDVTASENVLLDSGSANIATTLSTKEVTDLPNLGRNPYVMATLAAGVINTGSGGYFQGKSSQFTNPFSGVAVQITTDGNAGHNRLTLDGIPNDPAERFSGAGYTGFVPSPEAVEEVKVQTSIFDAQVGHGNGTVTNTVVRTGTNKLHGAAYYVFQNTYLNANTYERVPTQNAATSPTHRNNDQVAQTGFVIDGPVYIPKLYDGRNKTYFMAAYEFYQTHTAINYQAKVPTQAERGGDFSDLCTGGFNPSGQCISGVQIYDPLSPTDAAGNRSTFFLNNNLSSRINPAGANFIKYLPAPNVPGANAQSSFNYISNETSYRSSYPSFIVRFDQAIGTKNKLNVIFFRSGLTQAYPLEGFPQGIGPVTNGTGFGYTVYRNNRGGSLDDVHMFSPSLVLDSRLGVIYHPFGLTYPGNTNFDLTSLGIANNGFPYSSFPGFSATDTGASGATFSYAGLAPGAGGQVSQNTVGSLSEILTKLIGHHTLRVGFEGNLIRYNVQNPQSGLVGSSATQPGFAFDKRFTQKNSVSANVGADPNSGNPMASLLLGYPSQAYYSINIAYALQQIYMAPFVQDDWRVSKKLTLNLGARWDYESPFTERYNRMVSNFCTTCTNPLQSQVPSLTLNGGLQYVSNSNRFPYSRDLNNFQPRIGAAYQLAPTTFVRAGFGIIYFNTLETPIATGFSVTTSYNNFTSSAPLNSLSNPYPSGVTLPTGSSLGLATQLGQSVTFVDPNHVQPKSAEYSASIQQQFPGNLALQIAYVGTRPTRLEVNHNINVLPQAYYNQGAAGVTYLNATVPNPMAGKFSGTTGLNNANIARNLLLLPYPEFGSVTEQYSSIGSAPYNAMQIQISKPMSSHFSLQANFTWQKTMLRNGFVNNFGAYPQLYSVQDANATIASNVFGIVQLPRLLGNPAWQRLLLGGWQFNGVFRAQNGNLISVPGNVDIIGNPRQSNSTYARYINTCYQDVNGNPVASTASAPACDSLSPNPAYRQRLQYTTQLNSTMLNIRQRIHPLVDAALFKQFILREGTSFEIRGEFFNVFNTPNFGGPNTTLGNSSFGAVTLTQANDARIGQLTARINF